MQICLNKICPKRSDDIQFLLDKYENSLQNAPAGDTFEKLYDQKILEPIPEYQKFYDDVRAETANLGLQFRS